MPEFSRSLGLRALVAVLLFLAGVSSAARATSIPSSAFGDMHWRLVGPFRGGWATTVAGVPGDPATFYFGAADGGVWKTDDAGATWKPLFNHEGSASIGALAVAPSDPEVIWVGTGQIQQRWDIVDGDGVYRSADGGATWKHVGLADSEHVGAIWVDPRDADVAVVAALGHVFGANEERGLFRTEDGGKSWSKVDGLDADTGAVDIASDPAQPDILYASRWQVRRHPWLDYFQPTVGPGSGIVKSTDGGKSWSVVGSKGLPAGPLGRIELAVAPGTGSRRVWAGIERARGGGVWRTDDGGASWVEVNSDPSLASSYTSDLVADPKSSEIVWAMGQSLRRSLDGGHTFTYVKGSPGGDDYHSLWIDPSDPARMITGADQGAVVTLNGGRTWSSWYNQPTGQFYRLGVDDRFPYWIYSGQQDSGTVGIASRSDYGQLTFRDWHPVGGDERDGDVPDPADPNTVYGAGLGGHLSKWDATTGQVQNVSPWPISSYGARPGTTRYRYDWITPLAISKVAPHAIYQGAQVLFRSTDGGQTWQTISPDLSGADPKATGCDGDVPIERATACGFGTIFAISPSPIAADVVWVGTDNGRVQLTHDGGQSWTDVTPKTLPDWSKVNIIDASASDPATAYVAVDRHRADDFGPLAYRTHDFGQTWTEIGHGLPQGAWVGVVRSDPARPGLLYAGTSRGMSVSFDDGASWQSLELNLPTTGINDLAVHDDDLIAATQGRAIWILDDLTPLRALTPEALAAGPLLVPPARAYRVRFNANRDTPLPPEEPRGQNPPGGATIDYVLPDSTSGLVTLEIVDGSGTTVRRFSSDAAPEKIEARVYFTDLYLGAEPRLAATPGHHRFVWNLRSERPRALAYEYSIAAVPELPTPALPEGAFVLPGAYRVRLVADGKTLEQPLVVAMDPRTSVTEATLQQLLSFQQEVATALGRSYDLAAARSRVEKRLQTAMADLKTASLRTRIQRTLDEMAALSASRPEDPARINGTLAGLAADLEGADAAPTDPQRQVLTLETASLDRFEAKWKAFSKGTLAKLDGKLAKLGLGSEE